MSVSRSVLVGCAAMMVALSVSTDGSAGARQPRAAADRTISWLEFGDSYSSGEGIPDANAPCARSKSAYAPVAADLLRRQRGWTIAPEVFTACTGDVSSALFDTQAKPDDPQRPSQFSWALQAGWPEGTKADIVSYSFGGNDIGFADLIKSCIDVPTSWGDLGKFIGRRCPAQIDGQPLEQGMQGRIGQLQATLETLYTKTLTYLVADGGVLVVVGYPRLLAPSTAWGAWRGGRCAAVTSADADALGRLSVLLDQTTRDAVAAVDPSGSRIVYISRLDIFDQGKAGSHSLCGGQTEWLNRVTIGANDPQLRGERSFHPNAPGHAATAEAIANRLDGWFPSTPAPTQPTQPSVETAATEPAPVVPTTEPPIASGQTFEIGDEFSANCVVAWPTAPTYTSQGIDLTMSCSGVPNQFLFVDVFYPDPNLPITPSTGTVRVHGTIVDVAESALGFRELLVNADAVDIP